MTIGAGAPIYYDHANMLVACNNPNSIHTQNTQLTAYFRRYLLQKAISVFEWKLPDNWNRDFFLYVLYCWGVVAVIRTDKFGVIPQGCGPTGYNVQYQPTHAIITNPLLRGILSPQIGRQCELIKLQPDYGSVMDLVTTYADLMALALETTGANLLNSKLSYVFFAENKTAAESFKKLYDRVASGEPMAVIDKNLLMEDGSPAWQIFTQNVGQNYITDRLLNDMKTLEDQFNTVIGVPNANTQKRERMITDEVNANNVDTQCRVNLWLETMNKDIEQVNKMFGTDIKVKYRYDDITKVVEVNE